MPDIPPMPDMPLIPMPLMPDMPLIPPPMPPIEEPYMPLPLVPC
jgi:hypothetical protein